MCSFVDIFWKFTIIFVILLPGGRLDGSCPPTLPVDVCDALCGPEMSCSSPQLCCPTACGGSMCVDAVTKRHLVNLIKPGRCPEYPRGPWVCTSTCTSDSDCPRTLKCCANRCGAQLCQRPELDELPFAPTLNTNMTEHNNTIPDA